MNSHSATETDGISLPDLIEKQLQQQGISYRLRQAGQTETTPRRVQACLLSDNDGTVLALFPRDHLLDLKRVGELLGRELEPLRDQRLQRLLTQHQLNQMPGLPMLFNSPAIFEQSLGDEPVVWMDSGLQAGVSSWIRQMRVF